MRDVDRNPGGAAAPPVLRTPPAQPPVHRAAVGAPRGPRDVLALQRAAGNDAVRGLLAPVVQRCGDHIQAGCACAEGHDAASEPAGVQRDPDGGAPAAPACNPLGTRRVPGSDADSIDAALKDDCLPEAYNIIYGHAMPGLLAILEALQPRATYPKLRTSAAGMGGPRLETAIAVVDLKLRGTPVTGPDIRGLIDRMSSLPADQRRDILRYLGKLATIDVQGFPVDFSYCKGTTGKGCADEIKESLTFIKLIRSEYAAAKGNKSLRSGKDVDAHVIGEVQKKGWGTSVAGSTSSSGAVTVKAQPITQCEPIFTRSTEMHEGVHASTQKHLAKQYGSNQSPAYKAAWNDPDNWCDDEVKAYGVEIPFQQAVLKAIATLEGRL